MHFGKDSARSKVQTLSKLTKMNQNLGDRENPTNLRADLSSILRKSGVDQAKGWGNDINDLMTIELGRNPTRITEEAGRSPRYPQTAMQTRDSSRMEAVGVKSSLVPPLALGKLAKGKKGHVV